MKNINIIYVDGVCNLCNGFVRFVHKNNNNELYFSTLQSSKEFKNYNLESILFVENKKVYKGSKAVQKILIKMNSPYNFLGYFLKLLPIFFSGFIYKIVASNRYNLFGKKEYCELPSEIEKKYFI